MEQTTLFDQTGSQPLAARLRPAALEEYVGQAHLLGEGKILRRLIESDQISSMIFWGPPGWGRPPWPGLSPTAPRPLLSIFPP